MGLFDQDDIPILNSILGNGNGWNLQSQPASNLSSTLGLNAYGAGDRYSAVDPYNIGSSGLVPGTIATPVTGSPLMSSPTPAAPSPTPAASIIGSSGLVPGSPTPAAPSPTPNIGMQPGSPAPPMAAPINVGAGPGAGYPTQPPMRRPVGAPGMAAGGPANPDLDTKANWLGHALGITSPQQGQNIASQFLSGLGAGMSAAGQYANKPGGAAFAGAFGAAMEGAQKRGDIQGQRAFELMKFQAAQQQQDRMNQLLERKETFAEKNAARTDAIRELEAAARSDEMQHRSNYWDAYSEQRRDMALRDKGKQAWQLTAPGIYHQIEQEATNRANHRHSQNQFEQKEGIVTNDKYLENKAQIDKDRDAQIQDQLQKRGINPKDITQGTSESPHVPRTKIETLGMDGNAIFKAPFDGELPDGRKYKKGDLMQRGWDQYNSPNPPAQLPSPMQMYPQQPTPQTEAAPQPQGPSDQEIVAAANGG